jgi:hypothetical protein
MFIFADLLTNGQKGMLMFTHWAAFFGWEKKILNRANRQMLQYLTWMPINCYAKKMSDQIALHSLIGLDSGFVQYIVSCHYCIHRIYFYQGDCRFPLVIVICLVFTNCIFIFSICCNLSSRCISFCSFTAWSDWMLIDVQVTDILFCVFGHC